MGQRVAVRANSRVDRDPRLVRSSFGEGGSGPGRATPIEPRRTVLITGASSGIGDAFATVFAAGGFDLILTARRADALNRVAGRLAREHGRRVEVIVSDLSERDGVTRLCADIAARGLTVDALVNNAGYAIAGDYLITAWDRQAALLQVLLVAVTELSYRLLPGMVDRGYGRIINVASLIALMPAVPGYTLYPAAKAFVIKFSEALGHEVRHAGVHVTAVAPGFTDTPFLDVADLRDRVSALPRLAFSDADAVARAAYAAVMAGRPLEIPGRVNRAAAWLARVTPRALLSSLARRLPAEYAAGTALKDRRR
jgi:short-subunit dehydrogenase